MLRRSLLTLAALACTAMGQLQAVSSFGNNPTKISMAVYVPKKLATSPAIILAVSLLSNMKHGIRFADSLFLIAARLYGFRTGLLFPDKAAVICRSVRIRLDLPFHDEHE
jgi:hypothetical protein